MNKLIRRFLIKKWKKNNEFLINNELQVKELNSLLKPDDIDLLNQVENFQILLKKIFVLLIQL